MPRNECNGRCALPLYRETERNATPQRATAQPQRNGNEQRNVLDGFEEGEGKL